MPFQAVTMNDVIMMGPSATMLVVLSCRNPPPPVAEISISTTGVFTEAFTLDSRAHVAVPVASADESCVIAPNVKAPAATEPAGSEHVSVPSRVCVVINVSGPAGLVPV